VTGHATPREVAEQFVRASAGPDVDALAALYAPALTIEMPFAPPLWPASSQTGRDDLRARFAAGRTDRRYTSVEDVTIHDTSDPEVVIIEYTLRGERLREPLGEFAMPLVMVMTIRDGLIVHTRDYNSPIAGARAIGILPQLVSALQELAVAEPA
jgi:uncharacterized protein